MGILVEQSALYHIGTSFTLGMSNKIKTEIAYLKSAHSTFSVCKKDCYFLTFNRYHVD